MCGIAGIVGLEPRQDALARMSAAMHHRGPDDEGFYLEPGVGLAFRRLAIVDLAHGRQPMSNEDGQVWVVFNGEIYDHQLLRSQLESLGHSFATRNSDTEVLVHGWEQWGAGLFERLNGMFAVAIWDARDRSLTLARDRYGVKPLYYAAAPDGGLVFASEIKALLASGIVAKDPNPESLLEYFAFQNVWREPTMFRGVLHLDPATALTWRDGRTSRRAFWDIQFPRSREGAIGALAAEHRDILLRSIRRQIAADVPVKSYLSGGIDSTALTIGAHRLDHDITAYSCIFNLDGVGDDRASDERDFSRLVAERNGIERVELELSQDSLQACIASYVTAIEDLRMGMGYPIYLIAGRVAQDAKVVLSGTGGDEFHAGYVYRYQAVAGASASWLSTARLRAIARGVRNAMRDLRGGGATAARQPTPRTPEDIYRDILNQGVKTHELADVFTPEFLRAAGGFDAHQVAGDFLNRCPSRDWRERVMYVDAKTYLHGLLVLEDKLSMAHSLETRVPLLDNELVDFALDVPFDTLWHQDRGKILFRESVRPWVPREIYRKPKMGFGPPDGSWYRNRLRPWISDTLAELNSDGAGVFRPGYVGRVLDEHFTGAANRTALIWTLLNFEHWRRAFGFFGASAPAKSVSRPRAAAPRPKLLDPRLQRLSDSAIEGAP